MSDADARDRCPFCKSGKITNTTREISFQQMTDRGNIACRVTVPVGICDGCGAEITDAKAEAMIEEAVRRESAKLPPGSTRLK